MNHEKIIENEKESGEQINALSWQEDLTRRVLNAITLSPEMKEELSLDKYKAL